MNKTTFTNNLKKFITSSTCAFTCVNTIEERLKKQNFTKLNEEDNWKLNEGLFYITRNDASLVAFKIPKNYKEKFLIITSHCDTPSLLLKPSGNHIKDNYLKYNIMPYGGLLNYGWLDHPLSLAGRIIVEKKDKIEKRIVDFKKPMAIVPSVAIHLNDKANTNLDLNAQTDLQPIFAITDKEDSWSHLLEETLKPQEKLMDYELFLYNSLTPQTIGLKQDLLLSPRIDNITSVYSSLESFLETNGNNILVFCSFNNEEIGSLTREGADSNFLLDTLKRIAASLEIEIAPTLAKSFLISSDNTHAVHPNHPELSDETGKAFLGKGFTIIKEISSTTDAYFSSIIKSLCKKHNILYQDSTAKNDITGGSTLSGLSLRHVSIKSLEVGVPELAMHSSVEVANINDIYELYKMMKVFYKEI